MPKKSSTVPNRRPERSIKKRISDEPPAELRRTLQSIGIAADHGGYELKEYLAGKLRAAGHEVIDFGDGRPKQEDDYPDFIVPLARAVADRKVERGVGICGSGVGASVCANKVAGVGGLVVGHALAWELVQTFLAARFKDAERFRRRLAKVAELESKTAKETPWK